MELACEIVEVLDAGELATDAPTLETITYEEAMERELEYLKGKDLSLLHSPIGSGRPCAPFQELDPHPSLTTTKRKEMAVSLVEPAPQPVNDQNMPPRTVEYHLAGREPPVQQFIHQQPNAVQPLQLLLQGHPSASRQLQFRQTPIQQFEQSKPSLQQSNSRQHFEQQRFGQPLSQLTMTQTQQTLRQGQHQQYMPARPQLSVNQPNLQHYSRFQQSPFWCGACKIDCGSAPNFRSHRLGRKHKNKMQERKNKNKIGESFPAKNYSAGPANENVMLWCEDCKIRCPDEMNLADHFAGKKHAAVVQGLRANSSAPGLWRV